MRDAPCKEKTIGHQGKRKKEKGKRDTNYLFLFPFAFFLLIEDRG